MTGPPMISGIRRPKQALHMAIFFLIVGILFLLFGIFNKQTMAGIFMFIFFLVPFSISLIAEKKKFYKRWKKNLQKDIDNYKK